MKTTPHRHQSRFRPPAALSFVSETTKPRLGQPHSVQRDTAVAVVLALLALLAIGAAGATLDNPAAQSGSGIGSGGGSGLGAGSGADAPANQSGGSSGGSMQWAGELSGACMSVLMTLPAKLLLVGLVAAVSGYVWWRTDSLGMGLVTAALYGPIVWVFWFALAGCQTIQGAMQPPQPPTNRTSQTPTGNASGGGLGGAAEAATSQPSILLGLVLVVLVVAALVLLYVASGDDAGGKAEEPAAEPPEEPDVAAVGRVAGEAADRIEAEDDFGNEVFRAWAEMTEHLAVEHPESSTPAEFATAAVDAGMAPDDVGELTDLFEEVRYGDRAVTDEREARATAALRRIEESYAEGEE